MQKKFTIKVPNELWVDDWSDDKTISWTYIGNNPIYIEIDTFNVPVGLINKKEDHIGVNTSLIEFTATTDDEFAILECIKSQSENIEYTYEDEENFDGSIYKRIVNPKVSDYFEVVYFEDVFSLRQIVKNETLIIKDHLQTRKKYIKQFTDAYEFEGEDLTVINNYVSKLNVLEESMTNAKPWKHIEIDESILPKIPVKLVQLLESLPKL